MAQSNSGQVSIQGETIVWTDRKGRELNRIPVRGIKIIGEVTTDQGPFSDDWWIYFVLSADDYREVSAYALNFQSVLIELGEMIGTGLTCQLANSAKYQSRVLWPEEIRDQEFFEFFNDEPVGLLQKIKGSLGLNKLRVTLRDPILKILEEKNGN